MSFSYIQPKDLFVLFCLGGVLFIIFLSMWIVCMCTGAYAMAHMWKSDENFVELVLSLHLYMSSMNISHQGLRSKHLSPLRHLTSHDLLKTCLFIRIDLISNMERVFNNVPGFCNVNPHLFDLNRRKAWALQFRNSLGGGKQHGNELLPSQNFHRY